MPLHTVIHALDGWTTTFTYSFWFMLSMVVFTSWSSFFRPVIVSWSSWILSPQIKEKKQTVCKRSMKSHFFHSVLFYFIKPSYLLHPSFHPRSVAFEAALHWPECPGFHEDPDGNLPLSNRGNISTPFLSPSCKLSYTLASYMFGSWRSYRRDKLCIKLILVSNFVCFYAIKWKDALLLATRDYRKYFILATGNEMEHD